MSKPIGSSNHPNRGTHPPTLRFAASKVSPNKGGASVLPHMGRAFTDVQEMKQALEFYLKKCEILWGKSGNFDPV